MPESPEIAALRAIVELQGQLLKDALEISRQQLRQSAPADPGASPITLARELIGLARDLAPPALPPAVPQSDNPWVAIADRLASAMERMSARAPAPIAPGASVTVPIPRWAAPIAPYVAELVKYANSGQPAEVVAAMVAEQLPAPAVEGLRDLLASDGYPTNIIQVFPPLQPVAGWMTPFLFALRAKLQELGALNGHAPPAPPAPRGRRTRAGG